MIKNNQSCMNNLYNKIYEAVDKGIQKALIIDPELLNSSVGWHYKKVTTETNLIEQYVNELLHGNERERHIAYLELKKYSKKTNMVYKPTLDIFNDLVNIIQKDVKGYTGIKTQWADTSDFLSLILANGQEIPFEEYDENLHNVLFVKFKNTPCGHDIIIYAKYTIYDNTKYRNIEIRWKDGKQIYITTDGLNEVTFNDTDCINKEKYGSDKLAEDAAIIDYDGFEHTYNNIDIITKNRDYSQYPIFNKINDINRCIPLNYKCYLPSLGELYFLTKYPILINYILIKIQKKKPIFTKNDWFDIMSSTENDCYKIWTIDIMKDYKYKVSMMLKNSIYNMFMPFFKKIN